MRILHTGDWHIGQTLKNFGREHEHRLVLDQLAVIVADREVDAMIVAGDVFDSPNPSGASLKLFYDTLVRLSKARPGMSIVITAGNHDAAGRLEAPRALLGALNVHVTGNVRRPGGKLDQSQHFVQLRDQKGRIGAEVLAVSYPTAACLPVLAREGDEPVSVTRQVEALYRELHDAIRPLRTDVPLIVTGHLHVAGAIESEGAERRILIGGQHAVPSSVFPRDAAYVALGHLHKAQAVGKETVRYSGSLMPLSATEQPYTHSVTLLSLAGGATVVEQIRLRRPVPFMRLPQAGEMRIADLAGHLTALGLDANLPIEQQPFVEVRLAREGLQTGFRADAERIAEGFPVRLVDIKVATLAAEASAPSDDPFVRLAERVPEDLFRMAFQRAHNGAEPSADHLKIFHQIAAKV
jgi:DNA repair protein SbcD/Mre11